MPDSYGEDVNEMPVAVCGRLDDLRLNPSDRRDADGTICTWIETRKLTHRRTNRVSLLRVVRYESKDRFNSELEHWRCLTHPNLVGKIGFYEEFEAPNQQAILTEWLPRGSLSDLLKNRREWLQVSATDKVKMIVGLVLAVRYLHRVHFTHRGLFLDCILLGSDLEVKLETFPYHVALTDPEWEHMIDPDWTTHTAPQMSDEQCPWDLQPAANIFALGVIFAEILTGVRFDQHWKGMARRGPSRMQQDIARGERPNISSLPQETAAFIRCCWDEDPARRPTADQIFDQLRTVKYEWLQEVDSDEVSFYVDYVMEREKGFPPVARP
jgi:serine/threonine protein kinase